MSNCKEDVYKRQALVAAKQTNSAPVHKITIIPRTSGALGYTMQVEEDERYLLTKEEAMARIATLTGGRAAEELIFNSSTTGAANDIEKATKLARAMVTRYGMSEEFGMVALETVTNPYLGGDTTLTCSSETAAAVDKAVIEIIRKAHATAVNILKDNMDKLHELARHPVSYTHLNIMYIEYIIYRYCFLAISINKEAGMDIRQFQDLMWELFRSISHGINGTVRLIADSKGITMTQMRILVELKHRGESPVGDLALAVDSAPGNTSAMCKTLEKKGDVYKRQPKKPKFVKHKIVIIIIGTGV